MLNILLVTQDDPFYVPIFFKELLKHDISEKFNLKGIIIQKPLGKKSLKKLISQMVNFYGYLNFVVLGIKFVVFKLLNLIAIRVFKGKIFGTFSVEHILRKNELKIFTISNINSKDSLDFLRSLDLDIIFSIAASQVFKKNVLELPRMGCYNIHTSKLPKNRGMMPNFWSLYNHDFDPISAITIHKMNDKLDDGDILLQEEFSLNSKESLDSLIKRTKKMSADAFLRAIELLTIGNFELRHNNTLDATYNTFPQKDDVKRFRKKGLKLR